MTATERIRAERSARFPIGREVTLDELQHDPYPVFARLREREPISWIPALGMWYVVGYEDVRSALFDVARLTTASPQSTILDTFGEHMLTSEGGAHDRYRLAARQPFTPIAIRSTLEQSIRGAAAGLIGEFRARGTAELRGEFAARLPVQVMLSLCGIPGDAESRMRRWYDSFEAALANFTSDRLIRESARQCVHEFHAFLDAVIGSIRPEDAGSLIAHLVNAPSEARLEDEEIKRNLSIIFFGGISTVEALLLNSLWALFEHPDALERVHRDPKLIPQVIEETMRWLSPVQSATRHVTAEFEWRGIDFMPHDTVNCMLGAANRDPSIFPQPERFDLDRPNSRRHLGFAAGSHACLGSHLAKAEARIALEMLLGELPKLRLDRAATQPPSGYEFRQSRRLTVTWTKGGAGSIRSPSPRRS